MECANKLLTNYYLSSSYLQYLFKRNPEVENHTLLVRIEECLRFLYLSSFTTGNIPVNQKIDDIWHWLILETKAYAELCHKLPGKKFIHHSSDDMYSAETVIDSAKESKRNLEWLVSYVANFGPFLEPAVQYWTYARALMSHLHLNLFQFNEKLYSLLPTNHLKSFVPGEKTF